MRIVLPYKASIEAVVDLETDVITGFILHRDTFDSRSAEAPYFAGDWDNPDSPTADQIRQGHKIVDLAGKPGALAQCELEVD
jgi:hypothetical protein